MTIRTYPTSQWPAPLPPVLYKALKWKFGEFIPLDYTISEYPRDRLEEWSKSGPPWENLLHFKLPTGPRHFEFSAELVRCLDGRVYREVIVTLARLPVFECASEYRRWLNAVDGGSLIQAFYSASHPLENFG